MFLERGDRLLAYFPYYFVVHLTCFFDSRTEFSDSFILDGGRIFVLCPFRMNFESYSVGLLGRVNDLSQARFLLRSRQTQTSIPQVGFELTSPLFDRATALPL
jgi:hypothetical protein